MRVVFAGGGTGGHLYPGLAIARALVRVDPTVRPFFIGAQRGIERDVLPKTEFPHALLALHPLYRADFWNNWKTVQGAASAWTQLGKIVGAERPVLIVGTGGYAAGLTLAFGVVHRIPIVQQAGDSVPGLTARAFSRFSREIYLSFPEAARVLRARDAAVFVDTGAPIDPPPDRRPDQAAARETWGLGGGAGHVLLIYGGSQGSLAINRIVAEWIEQGLPGGLSLIWATGRRTYDEFKHLESDRVRVRDYLSPIADAYAASDLALTRAGAMTTAELFAWGIPPILVPLPTAAADHQTINAKTLEAAGAAVCVPQSLLTVQLLDDTVRRLIENPEALAALVAAGAGRARPRAAEDIARRITQVIRATRPV